MPSGGQLTEIWDARGSVYAQLEVVFQHSSARLKANPHAAVLEVREGVRHHRRRGMAAVERVSAHAP